jgi:hypothetical protein
VSRKGLVDRERELEALLAPMDAAIAGNGHLVLIEGPAGIGKTRLLAAAREAASKRGLKALLARGSELERDFPFGAVRQLLEPALAVLSERERASLFEGGAAHALPLLAETDAQQAGDPDYATLYGLYWLLVGLSQRTPLLLCVDDVHWVDAPSLRFLDFLSRRLDGMRLLLCAALRPAEPGTDRTLLSELALGAETLHPGPLTTAGAGALLGSKDPAFVQDCLDVTGGNPFYLHALAREVTTRGAGSGVRELGSEGISRLLLRRLEALGPGAPELARALAILGDGAALQEAARLAGLDPRTAAAVAGALARAEIAEGAERLSFVHPIVRTSIYGDVPAAVRIELHRAAASLLAEQGADPDRVAAQLLVAGPPRGWAVERLRTAAARALARGAPENAIAYTRRALEGQTDPELRLALLQELADAEAVLQDVAVIGHLQDAMALAADPVQRASIACRLVEMLVFAGQWDAAVALSASALEDLAERDADVALRLRTMWAAAGTYDPGLVGALEPRLDELRAAALAGGREGRALALLLGALYANRGDRLEEVVALVEHGLDSGRFLAEEHAEAWACPQAMMALIGVEELDRAERMSEEVLADARARGAVRGLTVALGVRVYTRGFRGELVEAEADLRIAAALAQEHHLLFGMPSVLRYGMDALLERPELAEMTALARDARAAAGARVHPVRGVRGRGARRGPAPGRGHGRRGRCAAPRGAHPRRAAVPQSGDVPMAVDACAGARLRGARRGAPARAGRARGRAPGRAAAWHRRRAAGAGADRGQRRAPAGGRGRAGALVVAPRVCPRPGRARRGAAARQPARRGARAAAHRPRPRAALWRHAPGRAGALRAARHRRPAAARRALRPRRADRE